MRLLKILYNFRMKIYLLLLLPILILTTRNAFSQQDATYTQFMYNGLAINPAYAGSAETFSATALFRKQWIGIEGAPETQTLTLDAPFHHKKIGLGLSLVNDQTGVTKNLNINGIYSYGIRVGKSTFAMGLQTGVNNFKADYLSVQTSSSTSTPHDDSFNDNINKVIFNFGSGLYFYSQRFFAGFSVPHILNQRLDGGPSTAEASSRQYRHYFVTAGYVFDLGEKLKVKPSTLLKLADGAPLQLDANFNFWYNESVCLGFSYRTNDSFSALFQIQIAKQLRLGYGYDYITSNLKQYNTGNHELMLRYDLPYKTSKIITPRYF